MIRLSLDRRGDDRARPELLEAHWRDPRARLLVITPQGRFDAATVGSGHNGTPLEPDDLFLGVGGSGPWFARAGQVDGGLTLREATELDEEQREVVTAATALMAWHGGEPHCESCHSETQPQPGGFSRVCTVCERVVFPRTDPAMIVALIDRDDRLLLAHQVTWPTGRASLLAGFTEAGESVEQAVVREVAEESRLTVTALRYLVSQPWPFPRSLMLAYVARAEGEPQVDGVEIEWARWFSRAEVDAEVASGELILAGPGSVARRVIELWRRGQLPRPEDAPVL